MTLSGPSCNLISTAAAATALGGGTATANQLSTGTISVCIYKVGTKELDLTLDTSSAAAATFAQAQAAAGATAVSGLGDQAVMFAQPSGNVVLTAMKGGVRVALGFGTTATTAIGDAATQAAILQALLAAVVGG